MGIVYAILVPALLSVLDGSVLEACHFRSADHIRAIVRSYLEQTEYHVLSALRADIGLLLVGWLLDPCLSLAASIASVSFSARFSFTGLLYLRCRIAS